MSLTEQQIKTALSAAVDHNTGKDFVAGKAVKNIKIDGDDVSFDIELGYPAKTQIDAIRKQVIAAVRTVSGVGNISANVFTKIVAHSVQMGVKLLPGVKNIIAVASGKGASARVRRPSIWHWRFPRKVLASVSWMPTSMVLRSRRCWAWPINSRNPATARAWSR